MDSFELDLGLDGVREAIRLLDTAIELRLDQMSILQEARRTLIDAKNALESATCPDSDADGPEIHSGMEF